MKKRITKLFLTCFVCLSWSVLSAQEQIKLIGFTSNGQSIDNLVKWNAGETSFTEINPVNYVGVLVGSSVYNSKIGEYYSRVLISENDDYVSKMLKYKTQNNSLLLTNVTSVYNGSAEVDMQTGLLYSYDGDLDNNLFLNRYNPVTQTSTNLGYYNFGEGTFFFPDSSCYDSDAGIYYFIIQDNEGKKLVKNFIQGDSFTYSILPLIGEEIAGNIGLEYSNELNTIHLIYSQYSYESETSTLKVGTLNEVTGEITNLSNLVDVSGLQLFNRTYDQNQETLVFIAIDLYDQQRLYLYNSLTNQLFNEQLPENILIEIEADNYEYAQARYDALGLLDLNTKPITISPNPASDSFMVNFDGNDSEYELFDLVGKSVQKGIVQNGQEINVNELNKGIYILNVKSTSFNENRKIVIQ